MTDILVFGSTGQVATELQRVAAVTALGRASADLSDPAACAAAILTYRPSAVINAAAYTAVDRAEDEEALATIINGEAPGAMAEACAALNIPLVHISTDYVFAGNGTAPWRPADATAPQNAYGRSKLAGEAGVRGAGATHAILRTSWVFSAHGNNFVKAMLRLSESRAELNVVDDQIGGPTPARAIAKACLSIAQALQSDPGKSGTYHFSGWPDVSWCDFAGAIFAATGKTTRVRGIASSDYPTRASRPLNSRLENTATEATFNIPRPDWQAGLRDCLSEMRVIK